MANHKDSVKKELLDKYISGNCTEFEKAQVEDWYLNFNTDGKDLSDAEIIDDLIEIQGKLNLITKKKEKKGTYLLLAAASIIVALCFVFLWNNKIVPQKNRTKNVVTKGENVMPGSNKAYLSLDGQASIPLDEDNNGIVSSNSSIHYTDGTKISELNVAQSVTISTPAAGQFQVTLPDGTKVWLNALSSISFPSVFDKSERKVSIKGEVFFDVFRDEKKPFTVNAGRQIIEVLGTSFNINSYEDNDNTYTTLISGSLAVKNPSIANKVILKPGQQAVSNIKSLLKVSAVNVEEIYSWKDGMYILNNEPLNEFAKKIERWYDVKVDMGKHGSKRLSAIIPRNAILSEVLAAIELKTGIKFYVEERRVMVKS